MLRITKLAIYGVITLCIWLYVLSISSDQYARTVVLLFPLVVVAIFGLSLFVSLVIGVLNFKTVPKEAELLQKDIKRATKELKSKGIDFE